MGFGLIKADMESIPKKYELLKNPNFKEHAISLVSPAESARLMPVLKGLESSGKLKTGARVDETILMPALFSTLGYALCAQGRSLKAHVQANRSSTELFQPYENNIQEGTRKFCHLLARKSHGAKEMELFVFFKPLTLH